MNFPTDQQERERVNLDNKKRSNFSREKNVSVLDVDSNRVCCTRVRTIPAWRVSGLEPHTYTHIYIRVKTECECAKRISWGSQQIKYTFSFSI